jgi:hypothetical protein
MYKIIGNDGKIYGPVSAEQIRAWISQGRVENRTPALPNGAVDWTFLGLLPEFAPDFSGPPPVIAPPKKPATTNGFATAGFVCGVISCVCCCGCPFSILGLVFSIIALAQINAQVEKQNGWGLALAGLICSAVSLLVGFGLGFLQLAFTPANLNWHVGPI